MKHGTIIANMLTWELMDKAIEKGVFEEYIDYGLEFLERGKDENGKLVTGCLLVVTGIK